MHSNPNYNTLQRNAGRTISIKEGWVTLVPFSWTQAFNNFNFQQSLILQAAKKQQIPYSLIKLADDPETVDVRARRSRPPSISLRAAGLNSEVTTLATRKNQAIPNLYKWQLRGAHQKQSIIQKSHDHHWQIRISTPTANRRHICYWDCPKIFPVSFRNWTSYASRATAHRVLSST